jgi:hypothetical protein
MQNLSDELRNISTVMAQDLASMFGTKSRSNEEIECMYSV